MSIIASVSVHDGLVLGAESMVQIWGKEGRGPSSGVIQTYENAQKLFQLGKHNIGVMTYGIGNIGQRSIGSYLDEFANKNADLKEVQENAGKLLEFLSAKYAENFKDMEQGQLPTLGIMVGGYGTEQHLAETWEFRIPSSAGIQPTRPNHEFGASWRGVSAPFARLYKGFDPRVRQALHSAGLKSEKVKEVLDPFHLPIVFDGMPVQEAIDFVVFVLQTTIGIAKFEIGPQSCGGPLWIAVVQPWAFTWIRQPKLKAEVQL